MSEPLNVALAQVSPLTIGPPATTGTVIVQLSPAKLIEKLAVPAALGVPVIV
jgi:hypothetical protein